MKHASGLLLGLVSLSAPACLTHQHGLDPDTEIVTIELKSGLG